MRILLGHMGRIGGALLMGAMLACVRCGKDSKTGAIAVLNGPATGYNTERRVLCEDCVGVFRVFCLPVEHVRSSDPVTAEGLAHIAACPECRERFGGPPVIIDKQRVAERFSRGGAAQ
jgi:hypothetical protein